MQLDGIISSEAKETLPAYAAICDIAGDLSGSFKVTATQPVLENGGLALHQEFAQSLGYSLVQSHLNGIAQLVCPELLPSIQFIKAPQPAPFLSDRWVCQELGKGFGTMLPLMVLSAAARDPAAAQVAETRGVFSAAGVSNIGKHMLFGAAYGGLLTPTDSPNILSGRLHNMLNTALVFGAGEFGSALMQSASKTRLLGSVLESKLVSAPLAGSLAGALSADLHSLVAEGRLAKTQDRTEAAVSFALMGFATAAGGTLVDRADQRRRLGALEQVGYDRTCFSDPSSLYRGIETQATTSSHTEIRQLKTPRSTVTELEAAGLEAHKRGDFAAAEQHYSESMTLQRQSADGSIINTARQLAKIKISLEKHSEAEPLLLDCVEHYRGTTPKTIKDLANAAYVHLALAGIYRLQSRFEAAEPLYQKALATCDEFWPSHQMTEVALDRYQKLLDASGRAQEAKVIGARLLAAQTGVPNFAEFAGRPSPNNDYQPSRESAVQAFRFQDDCLLRGKLIDGFLDNGVTGLGLFDRQGKINRSSDGPITRIDATTDGALRKLQDHVSTSFVSLKMDPELLCAALTQYTRKIMVPNGGSQQLVGWRNQFRQENAGQLVPLGDYVMLGKGVCNERMLLLKALADHMDVDLTMRRGFLTPKGGGFGEAHDFTTLKTADGHKVYDPGQGVYGEPLSRHTEYESPFIDGTWNESAEP